MRDWYRAVLHAWLGDSLKVADIWRDRLPSQENELALSQLVLEARNTGVRRIQRRLIRDRDGVPRELPIRSYPELSFWCDLMFELLNDEDQHVSQQREQLTIRYDKGVAYRLQEERKELLATSDEWVAEMTHSFMKALSKGEPMRLEPDDDWLLVVWGALGRKESTREAAVALFIDAEEQVKQPHTQLLDDIISATWRAMRALGPVCREEPYALSPKQVRKNLDGVKRYCGQQQPEQRSHLGSMVESTERDRITGKGQAMSVRVEPRMIEKQAGTAIDNESRELVLVGHVFSTVAEAGQIYRGYTNSDHGIDGEIEFKDDKGRASGKRLYLQLKSGDSYLKKRQRDATDVFQIKSARWADYWQQQAYAVMLVIRTPDGEIRWMDVSACLKRESVGGKAVRQIVFGGEQFDVMSVRRWRERFLGSRE